MSIDNQAYPSVPGSAKASQNIVPYRGNVRREHRVKLLGLLWFTGLSGSGKSTIAHAMGRQIFFGDNVR